MNRNNSAAPESSSQQQQQQQQQPQSSTTTKVNKPKCDVCGFGASHRGGRMKFLQCTDCKVYVHAECYCVPNIDETQPFTCHACDAVGKEFEAVELLKNLPSHKSNNDGGNDDAGGDDGDSDGAEAEFGEDNTNLLASNEDGVTTTKKPRTKNFNTTIVKVKQRTRPQKCAFCPIVGGDHALHPLFDNHGSRARRLYKCRTNEKSGKTKKELLWAHTLCANILTQTFGYTYGCTSDGAYEYGDDDDSDNEDDLEYRNKDDRERNHELLANDAFDAKYGESSVRYFRCYVCPSGGWDENPHYRYGRLADYTDKIKERQNEVSCSLCGEQDKVELFQGKYVNLRIPIQCNANEETEYEDFKYKHRNTATCYQPFHVGCARWGGENPQNLRRVYFFPGMDDIDSISCVYCNMHAEDVDPKVQKQRMIEEKEFKAKEAERKRLQKENRKMVMEQKHRDAQREADNRKKTQEEWKRASEIRSEKERLAAAKASLSKLKKVPKSMKSTSVHSQSASMQPSKRSSEQLSTERTSNNKKQKRTSTQNNIPEKRRSAPPGSWYYKEKDRYEELDTSEALAVNAGHQPKLKDKRRALADQNSSAKLKQIDIAKVVDFLMTKSVDSAGQLSEIVDFGSYRKYWKRQLSQLGTSDFLGVWTEAKREYHEQMSIKKKSVSTITIPRRKQKDDDDEKGGTRDANEKESANENGSHRSSLHTSLKKDSSVGSEDRKHPMKSEGDGSGKQKAREADESQLDNNQSNGPEMMNDFGNYGDNNDGHDARNTNNSTRAGEESTQVLPADEFSHLFVGQHFSGKEFELPEWKIVTDDSSYH